MEQPTIVVEDGLHLRRFDQDDVEAVRSAYADQEIQRWNFVRMDTQLEAEAWIAATRSGWKSETVATWAIAHRGGDTVLGRISLYFKDLPSGVAEVTYWVLPPARGSGIAARATRAVSEWAFRDVGLHRIELRHSTQNTASCRVADNAGFIEEGILRSAQMHLDGWHDMHLHSRIASE